MKVSRTVWNGESPKENGIIPDFTLSRLPIVIFVFSILNANVEEEGEMSLLEDVVISVKEAYALAKTID
ncbi:hypothetical protein F6Y03_03655 [Bacillus megaterium]|nr:hypothetical protein [Priestia megaterium]